MISKKILTIGAVSVAALAAPVFASYSWSTYHWERAGTNEITVPVIDNTTGVWRTDNPLISGTASYVQIAVADWNASDFIEAPLSSGDADPSCPIVGGEIHVCNDAYGNTGWVGIASISVTRGRTSHIIGGVTKLNDTYYALDYYDNPYWRQLVTCQEIGHDYGLGHQNENFETDETNSCMEYTSDATNNMRPDLHDYNQIASIYTHSHGGGDDGGGGGPGGGRGGGKGKKLGLSGIGPADWGTPIGRDAQGRANLYKRSEASFDVITHVTWAIGEGPNGDHDHTEGHKGPRQHSGDLHFWDLATLQD